MDDEKKKEISEKSKNSTDSKKVPENSAECSEKLSTDSVDAAIKLNDEELLKKYKFAIKKYISSTVGISVDLLLKDETGFRTGNKIMEKDSTKYSKEKNSVAKFNMKDFPPMRDMKESCMNDKVEGRGKEDEGQSSPFPVCTPNENNDIHSEDRMNNESPVGWRTIGESDDDDYDDDSKSAKSLSSTSTSTSTSPSKSAFTASTILNKDTSSVEKIVDNCAATMIDRKDKKDKNDMTISREDLSPSTLPSPPPLSSVPQSSWSSQLRKTAFAPLNYLPDLSLFPSSAQAPLPSSNPPSDTTMKKTIINVISIISLHTFSEMEFCFYDFYDCVLRLRKLFVSFMSLIFPFLY